MKTIIHIGQHRTGTTSIQKFLQDKRQALARKGFYVPSTIAGYSHPSHFILNVYALSEGRWSPMKEKISSNQGAEYLGYLEKHLREDIERIYNDAVKRNCNRVIWSNEGLYLLNTEIEYNRLYNLFSNYSNEIEVVCCFRNVESFRGSYINQLAKQNVEPSDNPDSYRYLEPDSWLFDYKRKKDLLSKTFDKCTCFTYDSKNNVSKFLDAVGIKGFDTSNYRLNVTKKSRDNSL